MTLFADRDVSYYGASKVTPETSSLKAVQAAYNKAAKGVTSDGRTPVLIEVIVRVSPIKSPT